MYDLEGRSIQADPEFGGGQGGLWRSAAASGDRPRGDWHDPLCGLHGGLGRGA